ncbi:MAG TPA: pyrroline-5-carboxylate reductase dimerization domain-containing protein [Methanobacteriaceae archaeon]|nr:pyrroline-5-carboxylate reductase dimerization domain-containing protein [Methanobacteriaceae archaeon]
MKKIGFVGYGSMGSMLIRGFLSSGAVKPENMVVSTRTISKLTPLQNRYPSIETAENSKILASKCSRIFIFVNTSEVKTVLDEIRSEIDENTHIIYIAAGLSIKNIETRFNGKITKVMPSLTSEVKKGVSLVCHNQKVDRQDAEFIEFLFNNIGNVKIIKEEDFEAASDLTSCAPAFIALIFQEFARAGYENSNLTQKEAEDLVIKTLQGTAQLLSEISSHDLISRVATKGGITEEGLKVLEKIIPSLFQELFEVTLKKNQDRKEIMDTKYS